jgi:hypothetical protein
MSTNTKQTLKRRFESSDQIKSRKLNRLNVTAVAVLARMKRGEALHMERRWYGPAWCLTGGRYVPDEVAKIVIQNVNVAPVGDALFANVPSQTWRWVEN